MHPDMDIMREAGEIIRQGGLVGFPTETVYGLGADALLPEGAKRIYAKKRASVRQSIDRAYRRF